MTGSTKRASLELIRGAWQSTVDERAKFYAFIFFFVIANSLDLAVVAALGYTLGVFTESGLNQEAFQRAMWGVAAYTALRMGYISFHHLARYLQIQVAYSSRMRSLTRIFSAMMSYPLRWHIETHTGENLSKLHRSAGAIENVVGNFIWQIIEGLVKVALAVSVVFMLDIWVATTVLIMSVFTILAMILFNQKLTRRIRQNNIFGNKINRICVDYLVNIVTVKTLGLEAPAQRYLHDQRSEGAAIMRKIAKYMELKWGSTGVGHCLVIGISLVIYFHRHRGVQSAVDVAQVYMLINYLDRIFQAIGSFTGYYSGIIEAATAYEDASVILEQEKVLPKEGAVQPLMPDWQILSIRDMNFSYVQDERIGLVDLSLNIKRGEKIALVGASGGGKSTLLKVLAGLLAPTSYTISTDTQTTVNIDALSKACLLIPQEPEVFSETVKYNLTMGDEFDPKELTFFLSLCKLDAVLAKLPGGWDSNLAEKGLNLSVGEKQRVALARGLLRAVQKSILLLDEPTSSLDPKTEKEIFLGLLYHFQEKTVLTACHRLNLAPLFDKIILFGNGAVIESGTFNELMERKGHFARAWDDYVSRSVPQTEAAAVVGA